MQDDADTGRFAGFPEDSVDFCISPCLVVFGTDFVGENSLDVVSWATSGRISPLAHSPRLCSPWNRLVLRVGSLALSRNSLHMKSI